MSAEGNPRTLFRSPRLAASLRSPWLADDTCVLESSSNPFVFEHMRVLPEPERSSPIADAEALSSHHQRDCQLEGTLGEELTSEKPFIARLQKTGLEVLQMNWDKLESEPVSLLHEYAKSAGVTLMFLERNSQGPSLHFTMYAVVDKKTFPDGSGISKREAKSQAAYLALCKLRKLLESQAAKESDLVPKSMLQNDQVREPPPIEHVIPHEDRCAAMCSEAFDRLLEKLPEYRSCKSSIAAFIMGKVNQESKDSNDDVYELVALGTGEVSYPGCVMFNGMLLHDAHALVVARRALQRFLYKHLMLFYSGNDMAREKSIFCKSKESELLSLKSNIFFHLYLRQVPTGAAENFYNRGNMWDISTQLHVHAKGVLKPVSYCRPSVLAARVCCMSGSDKLTRWNLLGIQGAIMSLIIKPVYITSFILGSMQMDTKTLSKVVNDRLQLYEEIGHTKLYCPSHIHIYKGQQISNPHSDPSCHTISLNWSKGDSAIEIVDGNTGKVTDNSPVQDGLCSSSRLCKAAMFSYFWKLLLASNKEDLLELNEYHHAKIKAEGYQLAKGQLYNHLDATGLGIWPSKILVDNFGFSVRSKQTESLKRRVIKPMLPMAREHGMRTQF